MASLFNVGMMYRLAVFTKGERLYQYVIQNHSDKVIEDAITDILAHLEKLPDITDICLCIRNLSNLVKPLRSNVALQTIRLSFRLSLRCTPSVYP